MLRRETLEERRGYAERISGKLRQIRSTAVHHYGLFRVRPKRRTLRGVPIVDLDEKHLLSQTVWIEPNRLGNPPMHIAQKGERFATLTGVSWLDENTFITLHRNGQRIGIFNAARSGEPIAVFDVAHQADDIAAYPRGEGAWSIAVSGCWDCSYSSFSLKRDAKNHDQFSLEHEDTLKENSRGFSHGISFNNLGEICYAIQAGNDPRIVIGKKVHRLPKPWGPRKVIFDAMRRRYLAPAVSANASFKAYASGQTTVWSCLEDGTSWECLFAITDAHSDSIGITEDHIWLPDQNSDRLLLLDAHTGDLQAVLASGNLDFPHGLDVSSDGKIAVTNYGSSSVTVFSTMDRDPLVG